MDTNSGQAATTPLPVPLQPDAYRLIERYFLIASGVKIATMTTIHAIVTSTGCSPGGPAPANGFGLPHSSRVDVLKVLTGFHSATGLRKSGSVEGARRRSR